MHKYLRLAVYIIVLRFHVMNHVVPGSMSLVAAGSSLRGPLPPALNAVGNSRQGTYFPIIRHGHEQAIIKTRFNTFGGLET